MSWFSKLFNSNSDNNFSLKGSSVTSASIDNGDLSEMIDSFCPMVNGYLSNPQVNAVINRLVNNTISIDIQGVDKNFRKQVLFNYLIYGQVFIYKSTPIIGYPEDFTYSVIDNQKVNVCVNRGEVLYNFTDEKDDLIHISKEEINKSFFHFKEFNPSNKYIGLSKMTSIRQVILRTNQGKNASLSLMVNGAPAGVISFNADGATQQELKAIKDSFKKDWSGGDKKGKISILSVKTEFEKIGLDNVDLNLKESEASDLSDVCRVYGYPEDLLKSDSAKYTNYKEAKSELFNQTILPLGEWESDVYNKLGFNTTFDIADKNEVQGDVTLLSQRLINEVTSGLISRSEARKILGYSEKEDIKDIDINGEK